METLDPVCLKAAAADVIGGPLSLRAKLLRKLIVPAVTAFHRLQEDGVSPEASVGWKAWAS
jgi:hypothetical protein